MGNIAEIEINLKTLTCECQSKGFTEVVKKFNSALGFLRYEQNIWILKNPNKARKIKNYVWK